MAQDSLVQQCLVGLVSFDLGQLIGEFAADHFSYTSCLHRVQDLLLLAATLLICFIQVSDVITNVTQPPNIKWVWFASNSIG